MRLEFNYIKLKNFFSFGSKWQKVEFEKGINLILGIDVGRDRSNGSGKSSFLESIPFALFGKVNREVTKEQIVNWKNRKNCEVEINFTKGDDEYTVLRTLKPDKLIISKNGVDLPMESRKLDFQKMFENEILGIDYKTFMSLIYTNINSTVPILTMKKPEKRKFLERVFGLEFIQEINNKANEKIRNIERKLHDLSVHHSFNERKKENAQKEVIELTKKLKNFKNFLPQLNELKEEEKLLSEQIKDVEKDYCEKKKEYGILEGDIEYLNFIVSKIGTKKDLVKSKIKLLGQQIKEIGNVDKDLSQLNSLQKEMEKYVALNTIEENLENKTSEVKKLEEKRESIIEHIRNIEMKMSSINSLIIRDKKTLEEMQQSKICPTCGQEIKNIEAIKEIQDKIRLNNIEIKKKQENRNIFGFKLKDVEKKIEIKREAIKRWNKDKEQIIRLQGEINSLLHFQNQKLRKEKLLRTTRKYKNALNKLQKKMNEFLKETEKIGTKLALISEDIEKVEKLMNKYDFVIKEIENIEEKISLEESYKKELLDMLEKYKREVSECEKENKKVKKEKEKLEHLYDYLNYIKLICKDENLKQYVISANMPYLNQQTNHYLSDVGTGFYVTLNKWLDLEIKGPGIRNATYGNLSGGESRGIDLSLQMAFLDFARVKAGVFPDILELDELLDSSIDGYGLRKIMRIVRMKQIEDDLKIFLVSHRKEVNDVNVDRVYLIEKINGYSSISLQ